MAIRRWSQFILIASTLFGSWLAMQAVHEFGHVCGAWITGGRVNQIVLHPLAISRTDLADNPRPLFVAWAGPIIGVLLPMIAWLLTAAVRMPGGFLVRFFAGFCLVANGLYIGLGSFGKIGDCREMLLHGSSLWQLWLFGAIATPIGFWLWHGQGRHFGFGAANGQVSSCTSYVTLAICVVLLIVGFVVDGR